MICLRRLFVAELLKLRTTRSAWTLAAGGAAVSVWLICIRIATSSKVDLRGEHGIREVLALAGAGAGVFALALGVVAMTGEYRHGTISQTFLAARARSRVVAAKVVACAAVGAMLGLVALVPAYAVAAVWIPSKDAGFWLGAPLVLEIGGGSLAACALLAAAGAGLGAIVKDQPLALAAGVGWMLVTDTLATRALPEVGRFLPGGAQAALLRHPEDELLSMPAGGLLLLGYAGVLVALAVHLTRRRDLT